MEDVINDYLEEKIQEVKSNNFHPNNFKQIRDIKAAIISASILNKKENLENYLRFKKIVEEERDKGQPFFRLEHVDRLGLEYDLLIFISEKNIGKSHEMLSHMNRAFENGEKFVLMRTLDTQISNGLKTHLNEAHSNFYIYGAENRILHKTEINWETGKKSVQAGIAMSLNTCINYKGGSFDNYKWLWFDEATDKHDKIGVESFRRLFISVINSIERKKKDFKVIITGNTDFDVSHPLFEFLELDPDQNLIYTKRQNPGADRATRILYINSRGLYKGANESRFIGAGGDPKAALDAFMNNATKSTDRIVAHDLTYLATPFICLVFKDVNGDKFQLTIAKHQYTTLIDGITTIKTETNNWYYLKIEPFQPAYLYGYKCYTSDVTIHALYRSFMYWKKDLSTEWLTIKNIIRSGKVIFIKEDTERFLHKFLERMTIGTELLLG